jgi:hypothetical protein
MSIELDGKRRTSSEKANGIIAWIMGLSQYYQIDPASSKIFLPFYSQRVVYELYTDDVHDADQSARSYFNLVWRDNLSHILIRKWLKFAKCDICVEFRERRKVMLDVQQKVALRDGERLHCKFVKGERLSYYMRRTRGVTYYATHISFIVDGADQQAYALPYFCQATHTSQKVPILK